MYLLLLKLRLIKTPNIIFNHITSISIETVTTPVASVLNADRNAVHPKRVTLQDHVVNIVVN